MNYSITFDLDGKRKDESFEADNPGTAFALCLKKYPRARLIGAETEARINKRSFGAIHYDPPIVQRPLAPRVRLGAHKPRKTEPYGSFPF